MKKVVMLLTNAFDPDVRVYKEALYLTSQGFEVCILCWDKDMSRNYPKNETLNSIELVRFKLPSVAGSGKKQVIAFFRFIHACKEYLRNHPCDYLHCNDLDGAIAGFLARRHKTPMVFDMHEFYEHGGKLERLFYRKLTIFLLKKSFAGIYENAAYLGAGYEIIQKKLYPLRNYPDTQMIQYREKSPSEKFRIGYHGVIRGQIPEFTALFEAVKELPNVRVDINGGGIDWLKLAELGSHYSKLADIHVNGPYNGATQSSTLYENTDVLFCGYSPDNPNYQGDAEVIKYYEAIITGTPMIMTESTGMSLKINKFGYGISCDTRNAQSIREAILKFINDRDFWETCSKNELSDAHKYNWDEEVKILNKIYV